MSNCHTCNKSTTECKRIVVKTPEGKVEYYCQKCAEARKELLKAHKQLRTFEKP